MYTPGDINNTARKINNIENDIRSSENKFRGELGTVEKWWKGEAVKAFISEYNEIGQEINLLYAGVNNLESGLRKLALSVQRADEERKEKKRLEQNKNNKGR